MKRLLFFLLFLSFSIPALAEITAGAAKVEITPETGTPLGGFGKRHGAASTGVHDPLYARALAVSKDGVSFLYISLDLVLVDRELRGAILEKIQAGENIPAENILITATHTHSGSGAYGSRFWQDFILGKKKKEVFDKIASGAARAAVESLRSMKTVSPEYAETDLGDLVENRMDERLNYPNTLKVLRFGGAGSLVFMAAHPTILPASNLLFSADFSGALCAEIDKSGGTCVFINGAAADLRPRTPPEEDRFKRMEIYSAAAAEKWKTLKFSPAPVAGSWTAAFEKAKLPKVKIRLGHFPVPSLFGARLFPRHSFFQALRMGDFLVFAIPAEVDSETGHEIEGHIRARGLRPLIAGYSNDYTAYVVSRRYYSDLSQYESQVSFYGSRMPWFIERKAIELAEKLLSEEEMRALRPEGRRDDKDGIPVVKIRGDAYHLGYEEGRLLKKEIRESADRIFGYFKSKLPVPLANGLLINSYLDRAWKKMEPYVTYSEYLHMKGLAEGSGLSFKTIKRLHALPEIYPSFCTAGAYWGKATEDGRMISIRNLDWNREIGIHKTPAVKWLETSGRKSYANIGYAGFSGVLSGMNEDGISVGQIGAESADESIEGTPMPFILKRMLEEAGTLEESRKILQRNFLTRGYNYVIAGAKEKKAFAAEATRSRLAFFTDLDEKETADYAVKVENAVFRGDPALDPEIRRLQTCAGGNPRKEGLEPPAGSSHEIRYQKHGQLIQEKFGKITPEKAIEAARALAPGSNIQSVVYAFPEFWVANAEENLKAAEAEYHHFSLEDLQK